MDHFPMDWWVFSCLAWWRIQPDLIITVDSELWPEHFIRPAMHGVPVIIINARLSDRTFQRLKLIQNCKEVALTQRIGDFNHL